MQHLKTYTAAVLAILFWGLSYIWSGRLVAQGIPVEYFLPIRIFFAAVILLVVNLVCGYSLKIRRRHLLTFFLLAACEPFIYFFCETYGIQFTGSPTISSLVIASTPVLAMVAGVMFFRPSPWASSSPSPAWARPSRWSFPRAWCSSRPTTCTRWPRLPALRWSAWA